MWRKAPSDTSILIVDDQRTNIMVLSLLLKKEGYTKIETTTDSREVMALVERFCPDLILLDLHMPHVDGYQLLEQLRLHSDGDFLPVLVITSDITNESKQRALASGAKDFLNKSFDATEGLLRIRNLLDTRFLHLALQRENASLEQRVKERTSELEAAHLELLERLARAAEYRDDETGEHTQRVGRLAADIGKTLGLDANAQELLLRTAPLHDIGKIGISDTILLKPGALTAAEFAVVKTHTTIGAAILSGSRSPLMRQAEEIAAYHHEAWDGSGYPKGLRGQEIPLAARITAVADVYDALTHARPYKPVWPMAEAIAEIERRSGTGFEPAIVAAFLGVVPAGKQGH